MRFEVDACIAEEEAAEDKVENKVEDLVEHPLGGARGAYGRAHSPGWSPGSRGEHRCYRGIIVIIKVLVLLTENTLNLWSCEWDDWWGDLLVRVLASLGGGT